MAKTPTDRYWAKKTSANPLLLRREGKLTLTNVALEKEIRKAHLAGISVGTKLGYEAGKIAKVTREDRNAMSQFFDQFTGDTDG